MKCLLSCLHFVNGKRLYFKQLTYHVFEVSDVVLSRFNSCIGSQNSILTLELLYRKLGTNTFITLSTRPKSLSKKSRSPKF